MKHLAGITRAPRTAQTSNPLCTSPESDMQVKLCFLISILTDFFLPIFDSKTSDGTDTTDTTA